jgi:hypothetical protein
MTKLEPVRFMRLPFVVTAYRVTEDNMEAISRWCRGHIIEPHNEGDRRFIRVPVDRPTKAWQSEAHVGSWVILSLQNREESFKVYTEEWMRRNFLEIPRESNEDVPLRGPVVEETSPDTRVDNAHDRVGSNVRALPVQGGHSKPLPGPRPIRSGN